MVTALPFVVKNLDLNGTSMYLFNNVPNISATSGVDGFNSAASTIKV